MNNVDVYQNTNTGSLAAGASLSNTFDVSGTGWVDGLAVSARTASGVEIDRNHLRVSISVGSTVWPKEGTPVPVAAVCGTGTQMSDLADAIRGVALTAEDSKITVKVSLSATAAAAAAEHDVTLFVRR